MNGKKLQDRLQLGLGLAARHIGQSASAYRPCGPYRPLEKQNRFLKLPAAFVSASGRDSRANGYGDCLWQGIFDASYTRPGDYLVLDNAIFFVASQDPLVPVLCVRTNRTTSITRPYKQTSAAGNGYGGYTSGHSTLLMECWPVCVFIASKSSLSGADLPTDGGTALWTIYMPSVASVLLVPGDVVCDDLGRTAVINTSELTNLGWRLSATMVTT